MSQILCRMYSDIQVKPDKIAQKVQQAVRPKEDAFAQVLPAATKEAICQALELLSLKIQEDGSHCSLVGLYLHQLGSVLSQAPSSEFVPREPSSLGFVHI